MTKDDLSEFVSTLLKKHTQGFGDYSFDVVLEAMYQDEEQLWHVPIRPDRDIERRGAFYDLLNDIEKEIEQDHQTNVMIVPVKPESATPAQ